MDPLSRCNPNGEGFTLQGTEAVKEDRMEAMEEVDDRETRTVEEAGRILGIGRSAAYAAVGRGEIPALRIGKRLLVPRAALERLLAGEQLGGGEAA